jgi:hypothetical protein
MASKGLEHGPLSSKRIRAHLGDYPPPWVSIKRKRSRSTTSSPRKTDVHRNGDVVAGHVDQALVRAVDAVDVLDPGLAVVAARVSVTVVVVLVASEGERAHREHTEAESDGDNTIDDSCKAAAEAGDSAEIDD